MVADINAADRLLLDWAAEICGPVEVSLAPPGSPGSGDRVSLYLYEMRGEPEGRGLEKASLRVALRYLVTTDAAEPAAAHRRLWDLVRSAAMRSERAASDWAVDLDALPPATWAALGVPPRPAFVLRVTVRQSAEQPKVPIVSEPPVIDLSQITTSAI